MSATVKAKSKSAIVNILTPIYTSKKSHNAEMLRDILTLYAKPGDHILDMTYGNGAFWRGTDTKQYTLVTNDLHKKADHHFDFRRIGLPDESFNLIVLDPPYVHGSQTIKKSLGDAYGSRPNGIGRIRGGELVLRTNWGTKRMPMNAAAITKLYKHGAAEAWRLLKPGGILVLKTQDEIESKKQVWRHFHLQHLWGFKLIDLFMVMQMGKPLIGTSNCQRIPPLQHQQHG